MADIARLASVLLGGTAGVLGSVDQSNKQNENRRLKEVMLADKQASAQKKAASTAKLQQVLEGMLSQGSIGQGQFDLTSALTDLDPEAGAAMASKFGSGNVEAEMKAHVADEEQSLDPRLGPEPEPGVTLQNQIRGMNVSRSGVADKPPKTRTVNEYGKETVYDEETGKKIRSYPKAEAPRTGEKPRYHYHEEIGEDGYLYNVKVDVDTDEEVSRRRGKPATSSDPIENRRLRSLRKSGGAKPAAPKSTVKPAAEQKKKDPLGIR